MPGVKRKAHGASAAAGPSQLPARKRAAAPAAPAASDSDSANSDFDDGDDLMAAAYAGAGADDDGEDSDSEDGGSDVFMSGAAPGALADAGYESEGDADGFEDLEADGGFEDLEAGGGDDDDSNMAAEADQQRDAMKRKSSGLYAMPTADEMNELRATGDLFRDGVFKLQIDEMLPTIRVKPDASAALDLLLQRLKQHFDGLPTLPGVPFKDAAASLAKAFPRAANTCIPWPGPAPTGKHTYGFAAPENVAVVGSWALRTAVKRPDGVDVDVAVQMPSSLFSAKDAREGRYGAKRAFYLACLAASISASKELDVDLRFELLDDDVRRPVLCLLPRKNADELDFSKAKATVRIWPTHDAALFPPARLGPRVGNVRADAGGDEDATGEASGEATPLYNASVMADSLMLPHLIFLHGIARTCPAFADACLLLKTWAFQRGLGSGTRKNAQRFGPLGTSRLRFVLTMMLAHLLQGEAPTPGGREKASRAKLGRNFSSYQLFRGVLDFLAATPWNATPIFMKHVEGLPDRSALIDRAEWSASALVDPTASLNLLASFAAGSLEHVAAEAKASLALLDLGGDHFGTLFLSDRSQPSFVFDDLAHFRLSSASASSALAGDAGSRSAAAARLVASVTARGLGRRAAYSTVLVSAAPTLWELDAERPKPSANVQLGVVLEPSEALKMVEHGPAPEDAAAAQAFKDFWGPLAELRRFRDGRIVESVVWPSAGPYSRWRIPRDIVRHVLQRHCSVEAKKVHFFAERFSGLLEVPKEVERLAALEPTEASGFQLVQASFQELVKSLRDLEGLPLSLVSVVPTAESLRSTSTFVPFPLRIDALGTRVPDTASYLPLHDAVMTLESSGRWPDDVPAIQAMKAAFYEKMAGLLPDHMAGSRASVVYDVDAATQGPLADTSALEIITSTGFAFRARIHHERERTLLERIIASRDETPARKREARSALVRFAQRFDSATRHHATIATLQARFIALGETARLLKRWVSAQMLSHVSPELLELLALHVFLQPGTQPHSAAAGFARTLQTLATWRWRDEPLLVACHAAVDAPEGEVVAPKFPLELAAQAEKALKTVRSQDPSKETRTWLIATETDVEGTDWASRGPTSAEAHLLQQLAAGAVQYLSERSVSLTAADVKALFMPSLAHYDFVIHLDPSALPRYAQSLSYDAARAVAPGAPPKSRFANLLDDVSRLGTKPRAGLDIGNEFVQLLLSLFDDTLRLFYDVHGGSVICGLWNPSLRASRPFKTLLGFASRPATAAADNSKKASVVLDEEAVCAEIMRLGAGLVTRVERRTSKAEAGH